MPRFVALLRGINVGGARKVPMSSLRALFDELGFSDVRTYIQSGNVEFAGTGTAARVRTAIEKGIASEFGFDVVVLLRTRAELAAIVKRNPYGDDAYVTFLSEPADAKRVKALDPTPFAPDEFVVHGREVFVRCPSGYGRTKINNSFFERKLATQATTRNWRTVTTMLEWASE